MTIDPDYGKGVHIAGSAREWLVSTGASLGTALLVIAPFLWLGSVWNGDIAFHEGSWLDVAEQWREGIGYPRWMEWANLGYGEPRFIFYPPLSWILGAALSFVVPWKAVQAVLLYLFKRWQDLAR